MQLHAYQLIVCLAALAHTVVAMPHRSGPYHGIRLPAHVSPNATNASSSSHHHNGTIADHLGSPMIPAQEHGQKSTQPPRHEAHAADLQQCRELCTLAMEMCVVAGPADQEFCGHEYVRCQQPCQS
ncbi:uncharacterized protein PFLUO_LOCUS5418 [Penicillium psychrofluorescens]|uniref:uncharacterized protein n=1 Tax=Penicillium psychrofluorescens TaxID=3158075 RepID=UPI003CCD8080